MVDSLAYPDPDWEEMDRYWNEDEEPDMRKMKPLPKDIVERAIPRGAKPTPPQDLGLQLLPDETTCEVCGAVVADERRHSAWHNLGNGEILSMISKALRERESEHGNAD